MSLPRVAVLEYGSGNVHSAVKALVRAGAEVSLTRDPVEIAEADGLLVPGVGAFDAVMRQLESVTGDAIIARRLDAGSPVLGICVGEQILFSRGIERGAETAGLARWPGTVRELEAPVLPHMGWNTVEVAAGSVLFDGIENERFYFVHSNAATEWDTAAGAPETARVSWAEHGERFIAAVEDGPLSATQFHPEKSGEPGIRLLENWVRSLG
ncbi:MULTISPECIES: imidazole glycerol phosphate synthase subunit HisH [unclassified Leucobacter]|uniref:imidazole glycerol phosphate synthase subunit HisH n=1 Tax=unclassified Leucobacter TaxID=2621730 RepID=UPI00165DEAC5|nr:imidazole glycerol phosphate synthase subunit HisH [Leucobacter sp. cx-87]